MTVKMQSFIDSSAIVVQYIPGLFHSREMAKELLEQISSLISASKPTPQNVIDEHILRKVGQNWMVGRFFTSALSEILEF